LEKQLRREIHAKCAVYAQAALVLGAMPPTTSSTSLLRLNLLEGIVGEVAGFFRTAGIPLGTAVHLDGIRLMIFGGVCGSRFTFRFALALNLPGILGAFVAGQGADHHVDAFADELGLKIRMAEWRDVLEEFLDDLETKLRVLHFAAAEFQRHFDLHVFAEEIDRVRRLYAEIVRIDSRAELHFLDGARVLMLLGFFFLLGLFVTVFAVIDNAANGRRGGRGNFHQVDPGSARLVQGVAKGDNPELFVIYANDPDFAGTDFPVDPYE
jgi:hypothetical protein